MKKGFHILVLILGFMSCKEELQYKSVSSILPKTQDDTIRLHKLDKKFVVGDFNGDRQKDTIFQHIRSEITGLEIENSADPYQNNWDTVVVWFFKQEAECYLTSKNIKDTLYLGTAKGLYCLINIGDNNRDGKDEIAFVVDYLDFSRLNSCKIFTVCDNKWTLLKRFDIHEDSFEYTSDTIPLFIDIKDYLENKNGKWMYLDYFLDVMQSEVKHPKMKDLSLEKCN